MAKTSLGKKFETKLREDWNNLEDSLIIRINDNFNGYKNISGISDFIAYHYPNIFFIECKEHKGNTFPLANLTQYDKLMSVQGIKGVRSGVVLWFSEKDTVVYVPVKTFKKLKEDGKKSLNINDINNYELIVVPSVKKRTFLDSDYSVLFNMEEGW